MVLLKIHQQQAPCYYFSIQQGILEVILLLIVVIDDFSPAFGTIHNRRNSICSLISSSSFFCASSWPIHDEGVSSSLLPRSTGVSIPRNFLDNPRQQTFHREDSRICEKLSHFFFSCYPLGFAPHPLDEVRLTVVFRIKFNRRGQAAKLFQEVGLIGHTSRTAFAGVWAVRKPQLQDSLVSLLCIASGLYEG